MTIRAAWDLLKQTVSEWSDDDASTQGAALAYYTAFSLAPLLLIAIGVAGLVFDPATVQDSVLKQIRGLAGEQGSTLISSMLDASRKPNASLIATVIGVVALLFGASGVVRQLQHALNLMWDVRQKPLGFWGTLRDRFFSFGMVVAIGFLLLVSLVVSSVLAAFGNWFSHIGPEALVHVIDLLVSLGVVTCLFALMFRFIPNAIVRWGDVWLGAFFTALLFSVGKLVIGLYLGKAGVASQFGAAGALLILLLWVYYSALIVFLGAEFTQVYANRFGAKVVPDSKAESLDREDAPAGQKR